MKEETKEKEDQEASPSATLRLKRFAEKRWMRLGPDIVDFLTSELFLFGLTSTLITVVSAAIFEALAPNVLPPGEPTWNYGNSVYFTLNMLLRYDHKPTHIRPFFSEALIFYCKKKVLGMETCIPQTIIV